MKSSAINLNSTFDNSNKKEKRKNIESGRDQIGKEG